MKYLRRALFKKLGYRKMDSRHQFTNSFDAQQKLIGSQKNPIIFDVGASVGQTTHEYRLKFPSATIYSFEPIPASYNSLKNRFLADPKVKPHLLALSQNEGHATFHLNKLPETSSLLSPSSKAPTGLLDNEAKICVQTQTLDNFCNKEKIAIIDILKMDVQGAELTILKGATELLKSKSISLIYSEVLFVPFYEGQTYFHDIAAFLHQYNYQLIDLFNCRYTDSGQLKWTDALFKRA